VFSPESRGSNRLIRQGATPITDVSELAAALDLESVRVTPDDSARDGVLRALTADPLRPDDLARALGIDIVHAGRTLGALEAQGLIARYPDGRYGVA
jgi:DNA processing protein